MIAIILDFWISQAFHANSQRAEIILRSELYTMSALGLIESQEEQKELDFYFLEFDQDYVESFTQSGFNGTQLLEGTIEPCKHLRRCPDSYENVSLTEFFTYFRSTTLQIWQKDFPDSIQNEEDRSFCSFLRLKETNTHFFGFRRLRKSSFHGFEHLAYFAFDK